MGRHYFWRAQVNKRKLMPDEWRMIKQKRNGRKLMKKSQSEWKSESEGRSRKLEAYFVPSSFIPFLRPLWVQKIRPIKFVWWFSVGIRSTFLVIWRFFFVVQFHLFLGKVVAWNRYLILSDKDKGAKAKEREIGRHKTEFLRDIIRFRFRYRFLGASESLALRNDPLFHPHTQVILLCHVPRISSVLLCFALSDLPLDRAS